VHVHPTQQGSGLHHEFTFTGELVAHTTVHQLQATSDVRRRNVAEYSRYEIEDPTARSRQ
jgi:hypothetical protein